LIKIKDGAKAEMEKVRIPVRKFFIYLKNNFL